MKKTVAVLLTVFNRKDITLKGLSTLYAAMKPVEDKYSFDVYMTNDGCTDGTPEAVKNCFPDVHIINGDGNLYWSGGMRKAWDVAAKTHDYDYYLWFNDDAVLYENALLLLFAPIEKISNDIIVSGAFCDNNGKVSYGGRNCKGNLIYPNGKFLDILYMNGNLTLIPQNVYSQLGSLDKAFMHGLGDWDYGFRAINIGIRTLLTQYFVGETCRHDNNLSYYSKELPFSKRLKMLYSPFHHPKLYFIFNLRHRGLLHAISFYIKQHISIFACYKF